MLAKTAKTVAKLESRISQCANALNSLPTISSPINCDVKKGARWPVRNKRDALLEGVDRLLHLAGVAANSQLGGSWVEQGRQVLLVRIKLTPLLK